jgi:hypothetical protein
MEFKTLFRSTGALLAGAALALAWVSPLEAAAQSVKVGNAWVRAPAPGQKTASVYVELTSERNAALVAAGSPAAAGVEMHTMSMDGGIMRMRAVPRIELPAGRTVKLGPGGLHLMLIEVRKPLKAGDKVRLVLSVQETGPAAGMSLTTLELEAEVRAAATAHSH